MIGTRPDVSAVIDRSLPNGVPKHRLDQLANRLTKILVETRKLKPAG
jgi:hypothetical protein